MKNLAKNYILIAKHCPECGALVAAKKKRSRRGDLFFQKTCSCCSWCSPVA